MGALIKFLGGAGDDLPPARARLFSVNAQIAGLEAKIGVLAGMRARLEDELSKKADAEREIDDLLDQGAEALVSRLRSGGDASLTTLSRRAEELDEKISVSRQQPKSSGGRSTRLSTS
jgi:hypothetical protein